MLDKWTIHPRITLDAGLRFDRDSVSDEGHVAPRLGFRDRSLRRHANGDPRWCRLFLRPHQLEYSHVFALTRADGHQIPLRRFGVWPRWYTSTVLRGRSTIRAARPWNVEIQQELLHDLVFRTGFSQRNTVRDFFVEPLRDADAGALILSNAGRNRYREFQVTARYQIQRHVLNGSYVRSSAIGDLNDFKTSFLGIRRVQSSVRTSAALCPSMRRTGFFFGGSSKLRGRSHWPRSSMFTRDFPIRWSTRNAISSVPENLAGRFPRFASVDLQATKEIALPIHGKKYKAHIGCRVFNLLNHYNPRDVQNNAGSERYGTFLNSVDRMVRGKFVLEF